MTIRENGEAVFDLQKAQASGKLHLIRKISVNKHGEVNFELYDAQAALVHLGRYFKLFTDKVEVSEPGPVVVEFVNDWW